MTRMTLAGRALAGMTLTGILSSRTTTCPAAVLALVACLAAFPHAGFVAPAGAQVLESEVSDLRYRVRQLERRLKSMRAAGGGDIPSTLATRFQNRLNQMERSIQKLTAKVEDLSHRVSQIEKDRKSFKADIDYRLGLLEKKGGGAGADGATGRRAQGGASRTGKTKAATRGRRAESGGGGSILPGGKVVDQYRFAINQLRQARYDRAARAFREFLRKHPGSQFAGNAYYWLGETYFAQKKYQLAAIRFADGFQKFPKHPKAPDNLLKLGMSMARLNKTREACASFAELRRRYPSAPGYVKRKAARERKKLACRV